MMDWHQSVRVWGPGSLIERVEYLEIQKRLHTSAGASRAAVDSGLLDGRQRRVYDKIVNHATLVCTATPFPPSYSMSTAPQGQDNPF